MQVILVTGSIGFEASKAGLENGKTMFVKCIFGR